MVPAPMMGRWLPFGREVVAQLLAGITDVKDDEENNDMSLAAWQAALESKMKHGREGLAGGENLFIS